MDNKEMNNKNSNGKGVILLNKPFLGGYLDKAGNIGHEIIDFLSTDKGEHGEHYIYKLPDGICPDDIWIDGTKFDRDKKEKYLGKYLVLTGNRKKNKSNGMYDTEILYVIELGEKLHRLHLKKEDKPTNGTSKKVYSVDDDSYKEMKDIIKKREIRYNGKLLNEIYNDVPAFYVTFKASKIYEAKSPIPISLNYNFARNKGYLYSDRNSNDYYDLLNLIEDKINKEDLSVFYPKKVSKGTINNNVMKKTFLNLICRETEEQVYTNILHSILSHGDLIKDFCKKFNKSNAQFDKNEHFEVFKETSIVNGRMDICAESETRRVIIENKVYSGLNGVKPEDNTTQLSTYYNWGTDKGKSKEPLCFITAPDFKVTELEREIKEKDSEMEAKYQIVPYSEVAKFIEDNKKKLSNHAYKGLLDDIISAFKNLSYSKGDLYAAMFLNATNN